MNKEEYTKMWKTRYYETPEAGDNLADARKRKLRYYKNNCKVHGYMLFYTNDQFCPACAKEKRDIRHKNDRVFNRARGIYNEIKRRAKTKGVDFELSLNDIRKIYGTVDKCPILGIDIEYQPGVLNDNSPSLDRFDPTIGYKLDNINIVSARANRIKNNATADELLQASIWMLNKMGYSSIDIQNVVREKIESLENS